MSLKWYLLRCSQVYEGFGAVLPFNTKEVTMSPSQHPPGVSSRNHREPSLRFFALMKYWFSALHLATLSVLFFIFILFKYIKRIVMHHISSYSIINIGLMCNSFYQKSEVLKKATHQYRSVNNKKFRIGISVPKNSSNW